MIKPSKASEANRFTPKLKSTEIRVPCPTRSLSLRKLREREREAMSSSLTEALLCHHCYTAAVLRPATGLASLGRLAAPCSLQRIRRRQPISLSTATSIRSSAAARNGSLVSNSVPSKNGVYIVGDFMTRKENLIVVKRSTSVDEALEKLVECRITGFPVIDDDWTLGWSCF
ncbi:CBS domain-containing protein CBSX1, chloroplastic [Apostasia shenzhenica]|uniref:CBS domain-containing protein CBSX1, chloroplastic n=1 Tax=Apostasia shenzhenica TaxID=1088818 RepID=A0A2I0B6X9_9ASPA|nr:CBS domain-containing protein CBSX1, chloroplastic [Apostasia shenzhenica]